MTCEEVDDWGGWSGQSKVEKLSAAVQAMRDSPASAQVQAQQCQIIEYLVLGDQAAKVPVSPRVA